MLEKPHIKNVPKEGLENRSFSEMPTAYQFGLLDPRPTDISKTSNEMLFNKAPNGVLGVEMTLPAYKDFCTLGNIDPQHTDGNINKAAIDEALIFPLPEKEVMFVTVRPDMDAFGAMAILSLRQKGCEFTPEILARVKVISDSDTFKKGSWQARDLPTLGNTDLDIENNPLAAIAAEVADFKKPLADRIKSVERWLETGEENEVYRTQINQGKIDGIKALESGEIKVTSVSDGKVAVVESGHRSGVDMGYCVAPTVIATNPKFSFNGSEPVVKHTICQYELGHVDLVSVLKELNEIEPGWGGSPAIIGSPQGKSSMITSEKLVEIVTKLLVKNDLTPNNI
jgi:hypothetical protein